MLNCRCDLAEGERDNLMIASRRSREVAGVPAIRGCEDSETHVAEVSRWLFLWRRGMADFCKVGELIVDGLRVGNAGVDPQSVAERQRFARFDRTRSGKRQGGAHPA